MMLITKVGTDYEVSTRDTIHTFCTLQATKAFVRAASRKVPKPALILEPLVTTPVHAPVPNALDAEMAHARAEALAEQARWNTRLPKTSGPVVHHVHGTAPSASDLDRYARD